MFDCRRGAPPFAAASAQFRRLPDSIRYPVIASVQFMVPPADSVRHPPKVAFVRHPVASLRPVADSVDFMVPADSVRHPVVASLRAVADSVRHPPKVALASLHDFMVGLNRPHVDGPHSRTIGRFRASLTVHAVHGRSVPHERRLFGRGRRLYERRADVLELVFLVRSSGMLVSCLYNSPGGELLPPSS